MLHIQDHITCFIITIRTFLWRTTCLVLRTITAVFNLCQCQRVHSRSWGRSCPHKNRTRLNVLFSILTFERGNLEDSIKSRCVAVLPPMVSGGAAAVVTGGEKEISSSRGHDATGTIQSPQLNSSSNQTHDCQHLLETDRK